MNRTFPLPTPLHEPHECNPHLTPALSPSGGEGEEIGGMVQGIKARNLFRRILSLGERGKRRQR
jgi:hypothetical protein